MIFTKITNNAQIVDGTSEGVGGILGSYTIVNANILNLNFDTCVNRGSITSETLNVGGMIGEIKTTDELTINKVEFKKSASDGDAILQAKGDTNSVGGLVGQITEVKEISIIGDGSGTGRTFTVSSANACAGGMIGYLGRNELTTITGYLSGGKDNFITIKGHMAGGFFGFIENSPIKGKDGDNKVTIHNGYMSVIATTDEGVAGGYIGLLDNNKIYEDENMYLYLYNITNYANIGSEGSKNICGGIIGHAAGEKLTLEKCSNNSSLSDFAINITSSDIAGGLIGKSELNSLVITKSSNVYNSIITGKSAVGGIVGKLISSEYNDGVITIVGCQVKNSEIYGVEGFEEKSALGGIVGWLTSRNSQIDIVNCSILGTSTNENIIIKYNDGEKSNTFAGGIIGYADGEGHTKVNGAHVKYATVSAYVAGGIYGGVAENTSISIDESITENVETSVENSTIEAYRFAGGLIGEIEDTDKKFPILSLGKNIFLKDNKFVALHIEEVSNSFKITQFVPETKSNDPNIEKKYKVELNKIKNEVTFIQTETIESGTVTKTKTGIYYTYELAIIKDPNTNTYKTFVSIDNIKGGFGITVGNNRNYDATVNGIYIDDLDKSVNISNYQYFNLNNVFSNYSLDDSCYENNEIKTRDIKGHVDLGSYESETAFTNAIEEILAPKKDEAQEKASLTHADIMKMINEQGVKCIYNIPGTNIDVTWIKGQEPTEFEDINDQLNPSEGSGRDDTGDDGNDDSGNTGDNTGDGGNTGGGNDGDDTGGGDNTGGGNDDSGEENKGADDVAIMNIYLAENSTAGDIYYNHVLKNSTNEIMSQKLGSVNRADIIKTALYIRQNSSGYAYSFTYNYYVDFESQVPQGFTKATTDTKFDGWNAKNVLENIAQQGKITFWYNSNYEIYWRIEDVKNAINANSLSWAWATDCCGFIRLVYAWNGQVAHAYPNSNQTLTDPDSQLKPGDVIYQSGQHILMFLYSENGKYYFIDESSRMIKEGTWNNSYMTIDGDVRQFSLYHSYFPS
jgi:hypothetical protein